MALPTLSEITAQTENFINGWISAAQANKARLESRLSQTSDPEEQTRLLGLILIQDLYIAQQQGGGGGPVPPPPAINQLDPVHSNAVYLDIIQAISDPDVDYSEYTVLIGSAEWVAFNLSITEYRNGDQIPLISNSSDWASATGGACCYYDFDPANYTLGLLYNYYAVIDPRGLAPVGFHVANKNDWGPLIQSLGSASIAGGPLKNINQGWGINLYATNTTGFTALGSGYCDGSGLFNGLSSYAYFWQEEGSGVFNCRYLQGNDQSLLIQLLNANYGCSVRIVKD
jgi:hypothetical protein